MSTGALPARGPLNVVLVEDEPRLRELLVRAVTDMGFVAAGASSAEEALRILENQPQHIAILDLNLPGMSGMELFERIHEQWPATRVIILTGFGDLESAKRAIHLDVVEFLTKPCHLGELEVALDRARRRICQPEPTPLHTPDAALPPGPDDSPRTLDELERQHILEALARNRGNRTATAAELGISLRTLYYRLTEYQKQGFSVD